MIILLSIIFQLAYCNYASWMAEIDALKEQLYQNPDNSKSRISLAYAYMMTNQALLALREYRTLAKDDPVNLDAQSGIIWALSILKQYPLAIATAEKLIKEYPSHAPFHNLIAYIHLQNKRYSSARYHYKKALELEAFDFTNRQIAFDGLSWVYFALGDFPGADENYHKAASLVRDPNIISGPHNLYDMHYNTAFSYAKPSKEKESFRFDQSISKKSWKAKFFAEEFRVQSEHYRISTGLELSKDMGLLQPGLGYQNLMGDYQNIYPAHIASIKTQSSVYLNKYIFYPSLRASWGRWKSFDTMQADIGMALYRDRWNLAYDYSLLSLDSESPDADTLYSRHKLQLLIPIYNTTLGLYFAEGLSSWMVFDNFIAIDRAEGIERFIGISAGIPITNSLYLLQYNQYGLANNEWEYLFYVQLSLRY